MSRALTSASENNHQQQQPQGDDKASSRGQAAKEEEEAAAATWCVYSAAQNLPAVLNDPTKGKQSNFFVRTWGDAFADRPADALPPSPFLPAVAAAHFDAYLRKYARKCRRHSRLSQNHLRAPKSSELLLTTPGTPGIHGLDEIPEIFMRAELSLSDPDTFAVVFPTLGMEETSSAAVKRAAGGSSRLLQEEFSHYLDIVEVQIARQVASKSSAFFHAMTSHDAIVEQMAAATGQVKEARSFVRSTDLNLCEKNLRLLGLVRRRTNHRSLTEKLRLMATVLQTQPMLQLLLSSSDYVAALELIASAQSVLARDLAGVTSLRHLPSQLREMSRLIDKMLNSEFERFAAADLHRRQDSDSESERLLGLVAGLLRQTDLTFLEVYKREAVTAVTAVLKQLAIEQLQEGEGDAEVTGSGDSPLNLDPERWLSLLLVAADALGQLVRRVGAVRDVVVRAAAPGELASPEQWGRVEAKLAALMQAVCDYCQDRLAAIVSEGVALAAPQLRALAELTERFGALCERSAGRQSPSLRVAFEAQSRRFALDFHAQRSAKLSLLLDAELWKPAEVPLGFQELLDRLGEEARLGSPSETCSASLRVDGDHFVAIGAVLMLLRLVNEYCVCAREMGFLAAAMGRNLAELLRTFNTRTYQLILGAKALRTAGLRTITTRHLALASRALQLVQRLFPRIRAIFPSEPSFDGVEKDVGHHVQQIKAKILAIMASLIGDQFADWEARPPVPSTTFRTVCRHLEKLHEAVNDILPSEAVGDIYAVIHAGFKDRLREQVGAKNIVNNGGPQHGVVTSEVTFYLKTLRKLAVLQDDQLTDKAMDEIWAR